MLKDFFDFPSQKKRCEFNEPTTTTCVKVKHSKVLEGAAESFKKMKNAECLGKIRMNNREICGERWENKRNKKISRDFWVTIFNTPHTHLTLALLSSSCIRRIGIYRWTSPMISTFSSTAQLPWLIFLSLVLVDEFFNFKAHPPPRALFSSSHVFAFRLVHFFNWSHSLFSFFRYNMKCAVMFISQPTTRISSL